MKRLFALIFPAAIMAFAACTITTTNPPPVEPAPPRSPKLPPPTPPPPPPQQYACFDVEPASAFIYLDGVYMGRVWDYMQNCLPVDYGEHRIVISQDGYATYDQYLDFTEGTTVGEGDHHPYLWASANHHYSAGA